MDKLKGVIWDWDGTIVNERVGLVDGLGRAFRNILNTNIFEVGEKIAQIEDNVREAMCRNFGEDPDKYLIPGARVLIESIGEAGIAQSIGTNNLAKYVSRMVVSAGFDRYINTVVGCDSVPKGKRKPDPEIFYMCADGMGILRSDLNSCVVIGNTVTDMVAAKEAGVNVRVALDTGFYGFAQNLRDATNVYSELKDIDVELLNGLVGLYQTKVYF